MFDTAVTLKYNQGHWKWYERVKLNEFYHHAKFDIYIYSVRENRAKLNFLTHLDTSPAGLPNTDHYIHIFYASQKS